MKELEEKEQQLAQIRQSIDQKENDLKAREAKLAELAPLIPSARQLQSMGITFDLMMPYLLAVNEKSALESIDQKTATYDIARTCREYRNLSSLRRAIEKAEQKLSALAALTTQKQQSITTLLNLQLHGFSENQIIELTGLVNNWNAG